MLKPRPNPGDKPACSILVGRVAHGTDKQDRSLDWRLASRPPPRRWRCNIGDHRQPAAAGGKRLRVRVGCNKCLIELRQVSLGKTREGVGLRFCPGSLMMSSLPAGESREASIRFGIIFITVDDEARTRYALLACQHLYERRKIKPRHMHDVVLGAVDPILERGTCLHPCECRKRGPPVLPEG